MKEHTLYIATKDHPGQISFTNTSGAPVEYPLNTLNGGDLLWRRNTDILICDCTDHLPSSRATNILTIAIG